MKVKALILAAGQLASRLLSGEEKENSTVGINEMVQQCAAQYHPSRLSNEAIRKSFIFFNGYDPSFLLGIQCEESKHGEEGFICHSKNSMVWSNVQQSKRLAKAQVLSYELCARAAGDQSIVADMFRVTTLPEHETTEAYHPNSVLNTLCQQNGWILERRLEGDELGLVLAHQADLQLVIPEQRKKIGSSIQHARYMLAIQTLQVLAARRPALMETLAHVIRGTSFQFGQTVTEEESDTLEYKMAEKDTAKALSMHITRHLCKAVVGFLNGPLLGDQQARVKRIVFGISDSLVVRGYQTNTYDRDHVEQHVQALLNTVQPRALFEAKVNWIPVLGAVSLPTNGEQYVMEVIVLRKEQKKEAEYVVFAENGDKKKIYIRLGPATYQLGRV